MEACTCKLGGGTGDGEEEEEEEEEERRGARGRRCKRWVLQQFCSCLLALSMPYRLLVGLVAVRHPLVCGTRVPRAFPDQTHGTRRSSWTINCFST